MDTAAQTVAPETPVNEGSTWDALGASSDDGDDIDVVYDDAAPGDAGQQDAPSQGNSQSEPDSDLPDIETEPHGEVVPLTDDDAGTGDAAPATGNTEANADGAEPWAADPKNFDFRTLPQAERAAAFQRWSQDYPALAYEQRMLYEGFEDKSQEAREAQRKAEDLERRMNDMEAARNAVPDAEAATAAEQQRLADYTAWAAEYVRSHDGNEPNYLDVADWAAERRDKAALADITPSIVAMRQRAENQLLAEFAAQMEAAKTQFADVPLSAAEEQEVGRVLGAMLQGRDDDTLRDGDVETAFRAVKGPEMRETETAREERTRRTQAAARRGQGTAPPSGGGPSTAPGPQPDARGRITVDAVRASQQKRGIGAIVKDYFASRR